MLLQLRGWPDKKGRIRGRTQKQLFNYFCSITWKARQSFTEYNKRSIRHGTGMEQVWNRYGTKA
jgi:hypothetical protein